MIRIIHVSDLHFGRHSDNATEKTSKLLNLIHSKYFSDPNTYLLLTGDIINGEEPFEVSTEWETAYKELQKFDKKIVIAPGNHDQSFLTGMLDDYKEFLNKFTVAGPTLSNSQVTVQTNGIDSTWWSPVLGLTGIGKIDSGELKKVKSFLNNHLTTFDWRLLYMHHRPIEPNFWTNIKLAFASFLSEKSIENLKTSLLTLQGTNKFLSLIKGNADFLCFGHDKDFNTDFRGGPFDPYWINSNREKVEDFGWVELEFHLCSCIVSTFDYSGNRLRNFQVNKCCRIG